MKNLGNESKPSAKYEFDIQKTYSIINASNITL